MLIMKATSVFTENLAWWIIIKNLPIDFLRGPWKPSAVKVPYREAILRCSSCLSRRRGAHRRTPLQSPSVTASWSPWKMATAPSRIDSISTWYELKVQPIRVMYRIGLNNRWALLSSPWRLRILMKIQRRQGGSHFEDVLAAWSAADHLNQCSGSWAFDWALIYHLMIRIATAIQKVRRLSHGQMACDFMSQHHQKRSVLQPLLAVTVAVVVSD